MSRGRSPRADLLRLAIAQEAARLMIEHGHDDFGTAKRKAAERLGVTDQAVLPKNAEIEEALAGRQRLFAAAEHADTLRELRDVAAEAMRLFEGFEPRLVGPVLSGTATAHNDIQLHLFADTPESAVLRLIDRGIRHEVAERRFRNARDEYDAWPALRFSAGGHEVEATIFPGDGIRQAPPGPVDGRPMRRATLAEVEELLEKGEKGEEKGEEKGDAPL